MITGVAGFIGSILADCLVAEGFDVVGIDNLSYGVLEQVPSAVAFHQADIRSADLAELFRGADIVYHLAAKNCLADCQNDPVETADINVTGSVRMFEAAGRARVPRVVYAESSALYEGCGVLPTPEGEVRPESFYAVSKFAGMAFADAFRRYRGLRLTGLRYFCVYGPRQDYRRTIPPVMSAFIIRLLCGERPVIYGTWEKRRDFVYVDDVNEFHLLCARDPRTENATFNLGSGTSYSVRQIYQMVRDLLGADAGPEYRPDLPGEAQETLADISAARALGWAPTTDLVTGLRRSTEYIRDRVLPKASPDRALV